MQPRPRGSPRQSPATTTSAQPDSSKSERRKSVIVVPSRVHNANADIEDGEQTEIAAQITIPHEGGWGWVVVAAAFSSIFLMDGVVYTFGVVLKDIKQELQLDESLISLINSTAVALYCSCGPVASALINRFGFRAVIMCGAIIVAFSLFCTYFVRSYFALLLIYGGLAGVGYCFINMSASLVVGFYFERLRSVALSLATAGSSLGVTIMFPINAYLVKVSSWRTLTLFQSGLFGIIYFLGMTFKPIMSLTVTNTDDQTQTVTYLPIVSSLAVKTTPSQVKFEGLAPTATEKLFSAVSNYNYPTVAKIVDEGVLVQATSNQSREQGPSTSPPPVSRLTLTANAPKGGMSQRQLKQVQSIVTKSADQDAKRNIELTINAEEPSKRKVSWWRRICYWEQHIPQSRPMYRDDVFYDGKLESLPVYQKSRMETTGEATGIEYQLAVTRAATTADLEENKGVCTTATRRILATMIDPKLLKRNSFLMFGASGFLVCLGYLVPYVFVLERSKAVGIEETHATWFVSAIGFSNAIGRLTLGALACKIDAIKLFIATCLIAGTSTALSNLSFNVYYQYLCWVIFGFSIASITCLRSVALVQLYGLEKLTSATGMLLLFSGIGCCLSTPAASIVKTSLGFSFAFYLSGLCVCLSGLCLVPISAMCKIENKQEEEAKGNVMIGPQPAPAPMTPRKRPPK